MPPIQIVETDADQPFHVRFTGRNGEPIVDGENLADRSSALTSIAAVAEAFGITMDRPPEWDDEVGGVIGETPEGVVHTYLVVDVDEREPVDEAPDEEEAP